MKEKICGLVLYSSKARVLYMRHQLSGDFVEVRTEAHTECQEGIKSPTIQNSWCGALDIHRETQGKNH